MYCRSARRGAFRNGASVRSLCEPRPRPSGASMRLLRCVWVGATGEHASWFWSEHCSSAYVVEKLRLLGGCFCFTTMQPDDVALSSSQAVQRDFGVDAGEIRRVLGLWQVRRSCLA